MPNEKHSITSPSGNGFELQFKISATLEMDSDTSKKMHDWENLRNIKQLKRHLIGMEQSIQVSINGTKYPLELFIEGVEWDSSNF